MFNFFTKKPRNYEDSLLKQYGNCNQLSHFGLKILFITDTHDCLYSDSETLNIIKCVNDYDFCFLLGDHSSNDLSIISDIIPKNKMAGILGNHDSLGKYSDYNIFDLHGKVINIHGVKFAGIAGSFNYKFSKGYAMYSHEESIEIADAMPNASILLSHDRPFVKEKFGNAHDGLKGITKYIYKNHIPLHIHGHLHENSEEFLKNGCKSICLYKAKILEI